MATGGSVQIGQPPGLVQGQQAEQMDQTKPKKTTRTLRCHRIETTWKLPDGTLHRDGKPAVKIFSTWGNCHPVYEAYYTHGKFNRNNGPAVTEFSLQTVGEKLLKMA